MNIKRITFTLNYGYIITWYKLIYQLIIYYYKYTIINNRNIKFKIYIKFRNLILYIIYMYS